MTLNRRQPSMEDDTKWKTTFNGRLPSIENNLQWSAFLGIWMHADIFLLKIWTRPDIIITMYCEISGRVQILFLPMYSGKSGHVHILFYQYILKYLDLSRYFFTNVFWNIWTCPDTLSGLDIFTWMDLKLGATL